MAEEGPSLRVDEDKLQLKPSMDDHVQNDEREKESPDDIERRARIRVKNRRKMFLDHNPAYFTSPDLELADPLLYDRCIRRFQTAAEREEDGRSKGYSGVLEADLYRSEAKLAALAGRDGEFYGMLEKSASHSLTYVKGPDGQVLPEDEDEIPSSKEEGQERWHEAMTLRFLQGRDVEFSYKEVDESEEWDILEKMDAEEEWFDDEEPEWIGDDPDTKGKDGETGIQDF